VKLNNCPRQSSSTLPRAILPAGFTLLELLVVVAIISVLASIAVPNLLLAQTRAKVARCQADERALSTALESYAVDNAGKYPWYGNPLDYALFAGEAIVFTPTSLTTPVAYMSSLPPDAFPGVRTGLAAGEKPPYFYMNDYECVYLGKTQPGGHVEDHFFSLTGTHRSVRWTLWSFGPDLHDDHGIVLYDVTNGTVSGGDLMRFGP